MLACAPTGGREPPTWQTGPVSEGGSQAETLDVDPIDTDPTEGTGPIGEADVEGGDEGFDCSGEDVQECMCPDGPGTGIQYCEAGMWGHCMCDGEGSGGGGTSGGAATSDDGGELEGSSGEPEPMPTEVCYPGEDESYTTCFPLHYFAPEAPPVGYEYPDALGGDPSYRRPVAYLDLEEIEPGTAVSPNFNLGELAQAEKGRYAIVLPSAVEALQELRDAAGSLLVNSGYRSPDYNAQIGGAGYSRHMYGDGYDLDPLEVTIDALELLCTGQGGFLVEYETHVHCDWRDVDLAVEFFGDADAAAPPAERGFAAVLREDGGTWSVDVEGFDEGAPVRAWVARDALGGVVARHVGASFDPPAHAVSVAVDVGRVVTVEGLVPLR